MTLAIDTDELMDTEDFAVEATIGATTINGIFDNGYSEALDAAYAGAAPTFLCATADLPAITRGTTQITLDGETYTIVERKPDGHGLETLVLES